MVAAFADESSHQREDCAWHFYRWALTREFVKSEKAEEAGPIRPVLSSTKNNLASRNISISCALRLLC
jgi:hypothetical protein